MSTMNNGSRPGRTPIWIGIAMMALALVVVVLTVLFAWRSTTGDASVVDADGQAHEVSLPSDKRYGVFVEEAHPARCTLVDADGREIRLGSVNGTYEVNEWTADRSFDTGDGDVSITCSPTTAGDDAKVRVGPLPGIGMLVGLIFGAVCLTLVLGGGGLALLIVGIVRHNRRPRY